MALVHDSNRISNHTSSDLEGIATKPVDEFRNYSNSDRQYTVENHYRDMRSLQTVEFVRKMHQKYSFSNGGRVKMTTISYETM